MSRNRYHVPSQKRIGEATSTDRPTLLSNPDENGSGGRRRNPAKYSCHSLRNGGATALLAAKIDSTTIKLHARWSSDVFQRHTRYSDKVGIELVAQMTGKGIHHTPPMNRH
ncbi:hypothetical protein PHMEG_0005531 [Phytophthora megakarya]|uniref:Uncharacterized protein n=1 Tax=Phytophthora megakarya TaxID=4795 RepID=A0A225WRA4_9STRA|nr:hypothetical protein PHMEG_0005531 [Phytophthora megakarya]